MPALRSFKKKERMKKIIAAFDGLQYSESTRDYAIHLAKQAKAHLTGVFMDDRTYTSYKVYDLILKEGVAGNKLKQLEAADQKKRDAAAADFEQACRSHGLQHSIHHNRNVALPELIHESIFADLLVINVKETLTHYPEKPPTRFIRNLLSDVQCPVLLVPPKYKPVEKIIFLYDGKPSSVYAVKMSSYLLPAFAHLEAEAVSVKKTETTLHLPDNRLMKELMKRHYPQVKYTVLKGFTEEEVVKHLKLQGEKAVVVTGAYRRSTVSRWFHESMADTLMKELKLPLFVAHNK
jgi:nucleotide-binding universal stress UspA family protein